jgi:golgi resident protein GCP60
LKLVAFSQQAIHGQLDLVKAPPLGMFDVIGKDRRMAWVNLGNLSKAQSMEGFIDLLDRLCPSFKPYIEAIRKDREEKTRLAAEQEKHELEQQQQEKVRLEVEQRIEDERNREEMQRRQLQDALNQQTYYQFKYEG